MRPTLSADHPGHRFGLAQRGLVHAVQAALVSCPSADPWPLGSPHRWDEQFLSSLEGLVPLWEVPEAGVKS